MARQNLLASIRGEYRSRASYKGNPYMTPSLAPRSWGAWTSNIVIASLLVVTGVIFLIISLSGYEGFYMVAWICLGVGGAFLLLGLCWYKSIQSAEGAEDLIEENADDDQMRLQSPDSINTTSTRLTVETEAERKGRTTDPATAKRGSTNRSSTRSNRHSMKQTK